MLLQVTGLFQTLSSRPELAKWVKKLGKPKTVRLSFLRFISMSLTELRDFPKAIYSSESYEALNKSCLRGLSNCATLRSCTWTRDHTLSSEILEVLSNCPALRELEINGHATGTYNPQLLLRFGSLAKISLIMPSADVVEILPNWVEKTGKTLTALHILCKVSRIVCVYLNHA